jgi:hypothetical protein
MRGPRRHGWPRLAVATFAGAVLTAGCGSVVAGGAVAVSGITTVTEGPGVATSPPAAASSSALSSAGSTAPATSAGPAPTSAMPARRRPARAPPRPPSLVSQRRGPGIATVGDRGVRVARLAHRRARRPRPGGVPPTLLDGGCRGRWSLVGQHGRHRVRRRLGGHLCGPGASAGTRCRRRIPRSSSSGGC